LIIPPVIFADLSPAAASGYAHRELCGRPALPRSIEGFERRCLELRAAAIPTDKRTAGAAGAADQRFAFGAERPARRRRAPGAGYRRDIYILGPDPERFCRTQKPLQPLWLQAEAILRPFEHGASGADFGLTNGARGFDIDNHPVVGIDQIIGGISKEGMALVRPRPLGRRVGPRDELRRHRRRRAESGIV
jgi:hypothetical protein